MESLTRSLNYELNASPTSASLMPDIHFNKYAQQILENSKNSFAATATAAAASSTPTITTLDATSSSDLLQKISDTIFNTLNLQNNLLKSDLHNTSATHGHRMDADIDFTPNHIAVNSFDAMDELQKQLEYDKFMNEVWMGIVLTLILISLVFCICSCFLYHQFKTWKQNYHSSTQLQNADIEAVKLQSDLEDPVPEYTLVSGLPSYEAALELLHKTPQSCLLVYPSVFNVFNKNEKPTTTTASATIANENARIAAELTTPLLTNTAATVAIAPVHQAVTAAEQVKSSLALLPSYSESVNLTSCNEKSQQTKKSTDKLAAAEDSEKSVIVTVKSDKC